ncbi:hypothetical protein MMC22_009012 [Lobaria immixta]|nr:hypothetical protein [Lobaria immixta]
MKSSVFTATALLGSSSLVFGRPQDTQVQIGDSTKDIAMNLDTNSNSFSTPPPAQFIPSSFPSSDSFPDLAFLDKTPAAVPGTISNPYGPFVSTGFSTDFTQLNTLPGDDSFNTASRVDDAASKSFPLLTADVESYVDDIFNGIFTWGTFVISRDLSKLVPSLFSVEKDWEGWNSFAGEVRQFRPSYALHPIEEGMMLLAARPYQVKASTLPQVAILLDNKLNFFDFVQGKVHDKFGMGKRIYSREVYDVRSLSHAINSHSHVAPINLEE